jgi:hypothetical protein
MTPSGRCTARKAGDSDDRDEEEETEIVIVMQRDADGGMMMSASTEEVEVGTKLFGSWWNFMATYERNGSR